MNDPEDGPGGSGPRKPFLLRELALRALLRKYELLKHGGYPHGVYLKMGTAGELHRMSLLGKGSVAERSIFNAAALTFQRGLCMRGNTRGCRGTR